MSETLRTVDGRGVLRIERTLSHPPEKVWRAITEPAQLHHWFPFDVEVEPTPGGKITFLDRDGAAPDTYGEVLEADPPRVFAFTWGDDELRWELRAAGQGTLLVFTHAFGDRAGAASFTAGWLTCIDGLELLLDGEPVEVENDMDAMHEHYVAEFGLADGTVAQDAAGWEVRFERQLTRQADRVWATLTEAGTPTVGRTPPKPFTTAEIPAGPVTAVDAPNTLEYEWQLDGEPAGRVRWELKQGTGQGARLILTQHGPGEAATERATALTAWRNHIEALAARLLTVAR